MSTDSGSTGSGAGTSERTAAGKVAFAAGLTLVLTTMVLGAFAGVALTGRLVDESFLSAIVPDDGVSTMMIGGIGLGGVTGLIVPVVLFGCIRGTEGNPRLRPREAVLKVLAVLAFDVYLLAVCVVTSQLGWVFPRGATLLFSVFVVGFSWVPLALLPWERWGLAKMVSPRLTTRGRRMQ